MSSRDESLYKGAAQQSFAISTPEDEKYAKYLREQLVSNCDFHKNSIKGKKVFKGQDEDPDEWMDISVGGGSRLYVTYGFRHREYCSSTRTHIIVPASSIMNKHIGDWYADWKEQAIIDGTP